jgi:drug/metabolite transporter (DMT)-like permease
MSSPTAEGVFSVTPLAFMLVVIKSLVIFVAWILAFLAIKKVPVSVYGICDMSRVIFSTLLGVFFLGESLTAKGIVSLLLVASGLYFANTKKSAENENYKMKYIWLIIAECFLNAVSGTMDKYIMSTGEITSSALQFWFMLLLSVFYLAYILIKREKLELKKAFTNPWLYVLSFSLILGDRMLFIANADPESQVTVMTLIKQSSAIVTIILGRLIYREKNILRKIICAGVILAGIALAII